MARRNDICLAVALALATASVAGCTVYEAAPGYYVPMSPASFDRSWSAAVGAFDDQGIRITSADRTAGVVSGDRDGIGVSANVRSQADGSVRVEFNTNGATARDPSLIDRVYQSYERRMGR